MLQPPASTPISRMIDRGVAHHLVLAVGERHRRRHRDRVAGVHAHRIEVLDRADDDDVVGAVAHHLELVLLPAEQRALDQHLVHGDWSSPRRTMLSYSSRLYAMPPPEPPSVNDGRMIAGSPSTPRRSERLVPRGRDPSLRALEPDRSIASAKSCGPRPPMARALAPISSTPYFSSTPRS
jgi:hypothetical protein